MTRPKIAIAALGGTLSMRSERQAEGITPRVGARELLDSVPELADLIDSYVETLCLEPSASLDFDRMLKVMEWANAQVQQGARGVVITQGTDTLEETAAFLDFLWQHDEPLVLTGAMRSASQISADGPGNLLEACRVASNESSRNRGVLVVMNGQIHQALEVRKTDTLALHAFTSPISGPTGLLIEQAVHYFHPPSFRLTVPRPLRTTHKVALLEATLGADTGMLEHLLLCGYEGLVVAGFGAGHVSDLWSRALAPIADKITVIVGSRTGSGATATSTYGFVGGEIDLRRQGIHLSGFLCPRKARILLWLLIGSAEQSALGLHLQRWRGV
jgi:L-asparaginase